ncbi:hypothetical protein M422DRAFT_194735, partial [Sphaerobolus stellatus SS14]
IGVWGYGMFFDYRLRILCVIPVSEVCLVLVDAPFGLFGYFLVRNVYPHLTVQAEQKVTCLFVIILVILHVAVTLTFMSLFFSYYVIDELAELDP